MKLTSDSVLKIYGHMNKDLLKALRLPEDWFIKKIGSMSLKEWEDIKKNLGDKNVRMLSHKKDPDDEHNFININIAISPSGLRIIKDNEMAKIIDEGTRI